MKEQLITFKTAKLAKEKGFNEKCFKHYDFNKHLSRISKSIDVVIGPYEELLLTDNLHYLAPTQSLLQKWLREVHKIIIVIDWEGTDGYFYKINFNSYYNVAGKNNKSYEECLEEALQKALKLIQ